MQIVAARSSRLSIKPPPPQPLPLPFLSPPPPSPPSYSPCQSFTQSLSRCPSSLVKPRCRRTRTSLRVVKWVDSVDERDRQTDRQKQRERDRGQRQRESADALSPVNHRVISGLKDSRCFCFKNQEYLFVISL